jgi:pyruvate dehydrogenase E2 component (dihydrolipoamide acetyltransferase)
MATILRMPEVLANTTHAVLETWSVAEGDTVTTGDLLAEIETEKALVELNAEADGILYRQLVASGDDVEVGAPIAVLAQAGETGIDIPALLGGEAAAPAERERTEPEPAEQMPAASDAIVAAGVAAASTKPAAATAVATTLNSDAEQSPVDGARRFASPLVRRMARERQLDLSALSGTGPGGRIVRRDVEAFLASRPAPEPARPAQPAREESAPSRPAASGTPYIEVPHTRMRQAIARRLSESKSTVPHFYLTADCRVDALLELRKQINASSPVKISVNDFVVKAVAAAFTTVPEANVTWTDAAMRQYSQVDISIAVATDGGLVTPVLRNVAARSLSGVSAGIAELAQRARAGRLRQDELEGGSFAVTNLGMFGTREFSAILNPPQSGILAVGAAQPQPVVDHGELVVGTVMRCTLSVDHRAIDGVLAARWLAAFTSYVENPLTALI